MTYELPAKSDEDYNVIGLSQDENKKFWLNEVDFNYQYNRVFNSFTVMACLALNSQLLYMFFDVIDIYTYVIVSIVHFIHASFFIYAIFHMIYTLNVFFITIMNFFRKKFNYISKQLEHIQHEKVELNNPKLSRLIYDFNYVYLELIHQNNYFKHLSGINFLHYSVSAVIASFIFMLNENLSMQIVGYTMLIFLYILVLYFPYQYSNFVITQVRSNNTIFKITF